MDSSRLEREMKRIKITLSKNVHKETLSVIVKANRDLREITHQNIYLESSRQKRRAKRPLIELKLLRKHAASLHHVFISGKAWKCSCRVLHMASLRLESRPDALGAVNHDPTTKVKFQILLSTSQERDTQWVASQWHEVEVIPSLDKNNEITTNIGPRASAGVVRFQPDSRTGTTAHVPPQSAVYHDCESISDICSAVCAAHGSDKPIGFLVDEQDEKYKHYVYKVDTVIGPDIRSKSLSDLLSYSGQRPATTPLSKKDCLQIAVTLASSVLQLEGTSWLKSHWSSTDIFFHEKGNQLSHLNYLYPHLSWKRCLTDINTVPFEPSFSRSFGIRNQVLFALGLTLIELCFGKTLADLREPEDGDLDDPNSTMRMAERLCDLVYYAMGSSYGDAVRRCLYQPFDVRQMSLDNEELQQKVFEGVVVPLNDDLNAFCSSYSR